MNGSERLGSLPMYDADPAAVQAWWSGIATEMRAEGIAGVPPVPSWPSDLEAHWRDPRLLLSQTDVREALFIGGFEAVPATAWTGSRFTGAVQDIPGH